MENPVGNSDLAEVVQETAQSDPFHGLLIHPHPHGDADRPIGDPMQMTLRVVVACFDSA